MSERILITEFMDSAAVETLSQAFDTTYAPELADAQERIPGLIGNVAALIVRNRTQVSAELLAAAPKLRCVGRLGVGLDNIDQAACAARDVEVYPATGANNLSVAEYVITTAAVLLRGAYMRKHEMLAGEWPRQAASGREISGKVLGLVGFGAIARDTAAIGRAMGMRVVAYDPFLPADHAVWDAAERRAMTEVLTAADILSLHVPLTTETRHMIGAPELAAMKAGAILINAARGGVVDEDALVQSLGSGQIGGAALDVFETEPLPAEVARKFKGLSNLILTPHVAGVTKESNERVSAMIAKLVADHLNK